jgi:tetratricopeptide (TPR) repeat protein
MPFPEYSFRSKDWGPYLLDIRQAIEKGIETSITTSKEQSHVMQANVEDIQFSVGNLKDDFNWALMLVVDKLDEQTDSLKQMVEQLEEIQHTLDSPLVTQARELFKIGNDRLNRGLYEKALHAFLQSEEKDDVYFPLHLQLGRLYLLGRNEQEDVTDFGKSEEHFLLAVRYAMAYQDALPRWQQCVGEARFYASQAAYLQAKKEQESGCQAQARTHLDRALNHAGNALEVWPELKDGMYLRARMLSLMERLPEAIHEMERLVDRDRRYLGRAKNNEDFDSLRKELANLPHQIRIAPGPISRQVRDLSQAIFIALASAQNAALEGSDLAKLQMIGQQIAKARSDSDRMNIDVEKLLRQTHEIKQSLVQLVTMALHLRIQSVQEANRPNYTRIAEIEQNKKEYAGKGLGCLLWLLLWFVVPPVAKELLSILGGRLNTVTTPLYGLTVAFCFVGGPLLFAFSKKVGALIRNPRLDREIVFHQQTIVNRDHYIAGWAAWLQDWQTGLKAVPSPPPFLARS